MADMHYSDQLVRAVRHYSAPHYFNKDMITPDDYLLASYPRSGNHFVRFTILSALQLKQTGDLPNDFSEFGKLPDIHRPDLDADSRFQPRVIKTHFQYDERYKNVIHLIRDPRDVVVSYYHYCHNEPHHYFVTPPGPPTLPQFVEHFLAGNIWPGNLQDHSRSFFDAPGDVNYLRVHYENLVSQPRTEFSRIFSFLDVELSHNELGRIIEHTTFDNMARLFNAETASKGTGFKDKNSITRRGTSGGHKAELDENTLSRLNEVFGDYRCTSDIC